MTALACLEPAPSVAVPAAFRDAMRRVASSVSLITARDAQGAPHGMAASAVIPVSMEPPSMLVAVNRGSGLHPIVSATGRFCVNILADAHRPLLDAFSQSSRRAERFTIGPWREDSHSLPRLESAPAAVSCVVEQSIDYATHTLFIGRVTQVHLAQGRREPLVWFGGGAVAIHPPA